MLLKILMVIPKNFGVLRVIILVQRKKSSLPDELLHGNIKASDSISKANALYNFFFSSFNQKVLKEPIVNVFINNNLCNVQFDELEVFEVLSKLKIGKANGLDTQFQTLS